jgi:hypothetical protein
VDTEAAAVERWHLTSPEKGLTVTAQPARYDICKCAHAQRGNNTMLGVALDFKSAKSRCAELQSADPDNQREHQSSWTMTLYFPKMIVP